MAPMIRALVLFMLSLALLAGPISASGADTAMQHGAMMMDHAAAGHMVAAGDADINADDIQPCHCPTAICAPASLLSSEAHGRVRSDFALVTLAPGEDVFAAGRAFAADPPPPRA